MVPIRVGGPRPGLALYSSFQVVCKTLPEAVRSRVPQQQWSPKEWAAELGPRKIDGFYM